MSSFLPKGYENKVLAKIYQSLRIEVNSEIDALIAEASNSDVVKKGVSIVLITYHAIEDRLVKRFIQNGCFESEPVKDDFGKLNLPFKKSFKFKVPSIHEIQINNRARSAKLRIADKIMSNNLKKILLGTFLVEDGSLRNWRFCNFSFYYAL